MYRALLALPEITRAGAVSTISTSSVSTSTAVAYTTRPACLASARLHLHRNLLSYTRSRTYTSATSVAPAPEPSSRRGLAVMASSSTGVVRVRKRLIVCCDGTWMNSDNGYNKPTFWRPKGSLQAPSNVTRISRCFRRECTDGRVQLISYKSGVGTGSTTVDTVLGGALGMGLSERIREAYSFICANYSDGDEIVMIGFSRGAFTVRSVAGLIGDFGLLTRSGIEYFYPIFKDMENRANDGYKDEFPDIPFPNKPRGPGAKEEYRKRLEDLGYTRVRQDKGKGELITIRAIAVWDTVGSLGIPQIPVLDKLGLQPSHKEYQFYDTNLSTRIEHAFQALALDEERAQFSPAVWERLPSNKGITDLRQVWFPGNHGNCGGGWEDQAMANITLTWMVDQLASIGVEFDDDELTRLLKQSFDYYDSHDSRPRHPWAVEPIYSDNFPRRPWAIGAIHKVTSFLYKLAGSTTRTPGLNAKKGGVLLTDTNERIHPSARVRLACKGLGLNDQGVWKNPALKGWSLVKTEHEDEVAAAESDTTGNGKHGVAELEQQLHDGSSTKWCWEYRGTGGTGANADDETKMLPEERLGPYERRYLEMAKGKDTNVMEFAEAAQHETA